MISLWIAILEQGLIFSIMALGVYITYKILNFPDLSVDGSFPLGAAITAIALLAGLNPLLASLLSLGGGLLAGGVTGLLHVKVKITNLLSGILVMISLYSVNLRVMGRSNVPLFTQRTIFSNEFPEIFTIMTVVLIVKILLDLFLKTKFGFVLRAVGNNPQMLTSLGVDIGRVKIVGLMLSNGLVALSGSMMAQYQGFSDVGMGSGMIVMGLASIILGQGLLKRATFIKSTSMALMGALIYQGNIALALRLGLPATDLKLVTAIIVVIALSMNEKKLSVSLKGWVKTGGGVHAASAKSSEGF